MGFQIIKLAFKGRELNIIHFLPRRIADPRILKSHIDQSVVISQLTSQEPKIEPLKRSVVLFSLENVMV